MQSRTTSVVAAIAMTTVGFALARPAHADIIVDFSGLEHGRIVSDQFADQGVFISAINPNRSHDLAIIFDSLETGTSDPDLEGPPWARGNLAPRTTLENMLIIAENDRDRNRDNIIDDPDDEGRRPGGQLIFDFAFEITSFGFDLVDVEGVREEDGGVAFYRGGVLQQEVFWSDLIDAGSEYYDPTIEFGDNSANRIAPFIYEPEDGGWDRVVINMGGSGAVDTLNFVPTPGTLAMLAGGGLLLGGRRRRAI
ncbi:MAG: hypothetical protein ACF8PN_10905 [Phycisphaerales bacterium]